MDDALRAGVAFLARERDRRGWWRDFDTLAGPSDEWVTAYVGGVLAACGGATAAECAGDAWRLLRRRVWWSAGWGYNRWVPADADSTAWGLLLAARVGAAGSRRARRAGTFLAAHVKPDGGVATYAEAGPIRRFTRLAKTFSFAGWCGTHPCVSAAAAPVVAPRTRARVLGYLREAQQPDGSWPCYWWCDPGYATALAAEALAPGGGSDRDAVRRAVEWALRGAAEAGAGSEAPDDPFAGAWRLRLLSLADDREGVRSRVQQELRRLLRAQHADGSWPSAARLRIPPPDVTDPERYRGWVVGGRGGGAIVSDGRRCFTTATALAALQKLRTSPQGTHDRV